MIAFESHRTLSRIVDVEILVGDGTFFACPKMFTQVYTIHGVFPDRSRQTITSLPLVYAFLPNKEKLTYQQLIIQGIFWRQKTSRLAQNHSNSILKLAP